MTPSSLVSSTEEVWYRPSLIPRLRPGNEAGTDLHVPEWKFLSICNMTSFPLSLSSFPPPLLPSFPPFFPSSFLPFLLPFLLPSFPPSFPLTLLPSFPSFSLLFSLPPLHLSLKRASHKMNSISSLTLLFSLCTPSCHLRASCWPWSSLSSTYTSEKRSEQ